MHIQCTEPVEVPFTDEQRSILYWNTSSNRSAGESISPVSFVATGIPGRMVSIYGFLIVRDSRVGRYEERKKYPPLRLTIVKLGE